MHPQVAQELCQVPGHPLVALSPWQQTQSMSQQSVCPCVTLSVVLALELPLQGRRQGDQGVPASIRCAWIKTEPQTAGRPLQYLSDCTYNETLLLVIARRLNLSKDTVSEY